MTNFLIQIEKLKWAIFGTVLLHIAVFVIMLLSTVQRPIEYVEDEVVAQIDQVELDDFDIQDQPQLDADGNVINAVRDMHDQRDPSQNFSKSNADQSARDNIRDFENQFNKELSENHKPDDEDKTLTSKNGKDETWKDPFANNGGSTGPPKGTTLVRVHEMKGRKQLSIPKPGYMCPGSGSVWMKIKVDKNGKVIEANPIASLSSSNQCMLQVAAKFARKSRFGYSAELGTQIGKIEYRFVGQ